MLQEISQEGTILVQGKECKEIVVLALHNLSFVAATGLPAPVFPKNSNVSYFLDNNVTKRFLGVQGGSNKQGAGNDVHDE